MKKPWKFRVIKRGGYGGETYKLFFQGRHMFTREWYPPWQNSLERGNAKCIVDDLNAAFVKRTK